MTNEEKLRSIVLDAAKAIGLEIDPSQIVIEHSRDAAHGDYSTNAAMRFCRLAGSKPHDLAERLIAEIRDPFLEKVEIAGPGFINFFLKQDALQGIVEKILSEGEQYGRAPRKGKKINVEYVSANPTGDLHLGHTRCAAVGDSIASLLDAAGYDVTREYYVNDCGNQVEHLGHSLHARYCELFGHHEVELGEDDYHGADLIKIAERIKEAPRRPLSRRQRGVPRFLHPLRHRRRASRRSRTTSPPSASSSTKSPTSRTSARTARSKRPWNS